MTEADCDLDNLGRTRPPTWAEGLSVKDKTREFWIYRKGEEYNKYWIDEEPIRPEDYYHVVEKSALDKANAEIAALTLAYNSLESVHFKEIDRLTKELAEEKQLRLSRERWVERVSEERDQLKAEVAALRGNEPEEYLTPYENELLTDNKTLKVKLELANLRLDHFQKLHTEFHPYKVIASKLAEFIDSIAPSWLPENVRDNRRSIIQQWRDLEKREIGV